MPPRPQRRPVRPGLLLGSQLVFNIGFFAVVPFLAGVLRDDFALGGVAVGLVLGARTAAQQGLFVFGGALADRWGARVLILTGCAIRVAGFGTLAWSTSALVGADVGLPLFVLGTLLTGLGGALFSPSIDLLVARAEADVPSVNAAASEATSSAAASLLEAARSDAALPAVDARPRVTLFALLAVFGEVGAALGPVLGAALLGWGFTTVAAAGALLFALVAATLALLLPADAPGAVARAPREASIHQRRTSETRAREGSEILTSEGGEPRGERSDALRTTASRPEDSRPDGLRLDDLGTDASNSDGPRSDAARAPRAGSLAEVVRDRRFMALAVLASVNLLAYNQLYLGFPVELTRVGLPVGWIAWLFVIVSALTIVVQVPVARLVGTWRPAVALRTGYLLLAASFAVLAVAAPHPGILHPAAPAVVAVVLLTLGHLVLGPLVLSLVPRFAPAHAWGAYYGMLATCGGVSVLLGNTVLGALYPLAASPTPAAFAPWLLLACLPLLPALLVPRLVPDRQPLTTPPLSDRKLHQKEEVS